MTTSPLSNFSPSSSSLLHFVLESTESKGLNIKLESGGKWCTFVVSYGAMRSQPEARIPLQEGSPVRVRHSARYCIPPLGCLPFFITTVDGVDGKVRKQGRR